jgi:hypothetical protein
MNDDTISMDAVREPLPVEDPWSIQSYDFRDEESGFGFVSLGDRDSDKPWRAFLAPMGRDEHPFDGWFATAEEAKAALTAVADQIRARNAEAKA